MNYVIKIKYEDTLRRLTYPGNRPHGDEVGDKLTFAKLEAKIRDLFKLPESASIRVTYTDKDNDVITMGDTQDLDDACVLQGLNPLRLNVTLVGARRASQNEHRTSPSNKEDALNLKQMLQGFPADVMKPVVDHVQQLLKGRAASPLQLTELVDTVVHTVTSHIDSAVNKVAVVPHNVTPDVSSSCRGQTAPATSHNAVSGPVDPQFGLQNAPRTTGIAGVPIHTPVPAAVRPVSGVVQKRMCDNEVFETGNASRVFHSGVQCDGCGMNPIVGTRFKSTKKNDYDLCVTCYKELGNGSDYYRIERPLFRPRHLRCPAMNPNIHAGRGVGLPVRGSYGARHEPLRSAVHPTSGFGKLDARFVQDVTIFDGTELAPLTCFTKIWRLRNSGTLPWPVETKLVHVGGDELGNVVHVPLEMPEQGLAPGEEVEVSVELVAPEKPGRYVSHWRLASPAGPKFGHRVWVLIQVVSKERCEDALISEMSSPLTFENVNKEDIASIGGSKSTDTGVDKGAQGVLTGHTLFLAEDYPRGLSSLLSDADGRSTKEGPLELPSEPMAEGAVDVESQVQIGSVGMTSMPGSMENDVIREDNDLSVKAESFPKEENVHQVVVGGGASVEKSGSVASETMSVEDVSAFVNSELGGFSLVDMPQLVSSSSSGMTLSNASVEDPSSGLAVRNSSSSLTPTDTFAREDESDSSTEEGTLDKSVTVLSLCEKLEGMGFNDRTLNLELLEKNNMDLRRTVDEYLFAATEWDPILEELEEMGFYDLQMNRRLMFKNNGSVKRVVKELVQMYKEPAGGGKDKGKGKEVA